MKRANVEDFSKPTLQPNLALKLLRTEVSALSWRYALFCMLTCLFAFALTLPPRLYVFYSENIAEMQLGQVSAPEFIKQFFMFSLGVINL